MTEPTALRDIADPHRSAHFTSTIALVAPDGVEHVVARIYDPDRAQVYQRLGIPTVATVRWTADQVLRRMLPQGQASEMTDASGRLVVAEIQVSPAWVGRRLSTIEEATGARVAYITRLGEGILPGPDTVHQEGDLVHLVIRRESVHDVERILDGNPPQED